LWNHVEARWVRPPTLRRRHQTKSLGRSETPRSISTYGEFERETLCYCGTVPVKSSKETNGMSPATSCRSSPAATSRRFSGLQSAAERYCFCTRFSIWVSVSWYLSGG
jgi:hypothetical protein